MRNVTLARVDDRLIHGQVVVEWIPTYDINYLMIIDDATARNKLIRRVLNSSAPSNLEFHIYSVKKAAEVLMESAANPKEKIMILTKSTNVFPELMKAGCEFDAVNLGGMGMHEQRTPLFRNISCDEEELAAIRYMMDAGVEVYYQLVPEQKRYEAADFIK